MATQFLKDLEAVTISKLQVEDDAVVFVDKSKRARFFAGRCGVHGVCFIAQDARDKLEDRFVIVDDKDAHFSVQAATARVDRTTGVSLKPWANCSGHIKTGESLCPLPFFTAEPLIRTLLRR